jgi:lipopolysaccharide/colanic/teichoic acid biosynthesis glycosyltransferase
MSDINAGIIALLNTEDATYGLLKSFDFGNFKIVRFESIIELCKDSDKLKLNICGIISESEVMGTYGAGLIEILKKNNLQHVPFFLVADVLNDKLIRYCLQEGVADVFTKPIDREKLETRVRFQIEHWGGLRSKKGVDETVTYTTPLPKRMFDIFFASMALLCLSPILLIVIILMKLESRGPVFYYSLRVGTGYRIFKFYKFRSMFVNADKRLKELQHLNQYGAAKGDDDADNKPFLCDDCRAEGVKCRRPLYSDKNTWCEKQYMINKKLQAGSAFFKLKNDPRVTKVGHFIRNTSIDELPQLWNVMKGDMSIVGNRPLPLYEAEKLTTDKYATRFLAPAGITGLWQVEKRGKGEMSEEERLMLDNKYALNHSFWYDIKLILKTIPALLQKENV